MKIKDIKGYEGLYGITEDGKVWSYHKQSWKVPFNNGTGYIGVTLNKNKQIKNFYIHRLVASAFIGEIPERIYS